MRGVSPDSLTGFVDLYKPVDMTSSDAVCIVRGVLSRMIGGRQKTGHLGTLDPAACGVLPIALGKATKLFDILAFKQKEYVARFTFGRTTDTLDSAGSVTQRGGRVPAREEVERAARELTGRIMQVPPAYSAKSVDGRRAYSYARSGSAVELPAKEVFVKEIRLLSAEGDTFEFSVVCGGGTYIRSLARDMAARLGTVAYMSALTRTRSGVFTAADAVSLEEFRKDPLKYVLPVDFALAEFATLELGEDAVKALNGVPVKAVGVRDGTVRVTSADELVGIGDVTDGRLRLKIRL